ncbi:hypothetical protein Dimus_023890 [Dionaea muscipula]
MAHAKPQTPLTSHGGQKDWPRTERGSPIVSPLGAKTTGGKNGKYYVVNDSSTLSMSNPKPVHTTTCRHPTVSPFGSSLANPCALKGSNTARRNLGGNDGSCQATNPIDCQGCRQKDWSRIERGSPIVSSALVPRQLAARMVNTMSSMTRQTLAC